MASRKIKVDKEDAGKRIDILAAEKTGITRSQIRKLTEMGFLQVNSMPVSRNYRTKADDIVEIKIPEEKTTELIPEAIPLEILYKDQYLAVVNKPPGMVVYPAAGHSRGTLMNALAYRCKKLAGVGGPLRPGVVHRLDKDTSGVMVVALDDSAYYNLVEQFRHRTINRKYIALIYGSPRENKGEISLNIGRSESDRKKMSTKARRGKEAVTTWRVIERFPGAALVEARLKTGRTHQIRVHFSSIGHPVLGDRTYGKKTEMETGKRRKISFPRQMLHAGLLGFTHPVTGDYLEFKSPLPEDIEEGIRELRA
ncbi:MAG: RluA family pseudouridine synthase [Nitrospirae bacterium]|nr:MAG: RluA family pseudouridine synthase [Nitrospirota bacterium]